LGEAANCYYCPVAQSCSTPCGSVDFITALPSSREGHEIIFF